MLIKFFSRGTGSGSGGIDYLTNKVDPISKQPRDPSPEVLNFGSPLHTANIIDSLKFKNKYSSGVLSFAPEDDPSEEEQQELIADFEAIAFAGIKEENRNILWVRHTHTDTKRVELHFITPKVELSSGKSLNIAPPQWKGYFYPWQKKWNLKKRWASPDDPARAKVAPPPGTTFEARRRAAKGLEPPADTRSRSTAAIAKAIANGEAKDRAGILKVLKNGGFEVVRATSKSITIKNQEWAGNPKASQAKVRLKSQVFYADWTLAKQLDPPLIDAAGEIAKLNTRIGLQVNRRREGNHEYYPLNISPAKKSQPQRIDSLSKTIKKALGDRAIIPSSAIAQDRQELQDFKAKISLVDLAIAQGYIKDVKASSTNSVKLAHQNGSKIVIKPSTNEPDLYFSLDNPSESGSVIDFVQHHHQVKLGQARKILREYLGQQQRGKSGKAIARQGLAMLGQKQKKRVVAKAFVAKDYGNLVRHQYLELDRKLSFSLFKSDRFSGQILIDERNNAVFPYRDGKGITGHERRNIDFKRFEPGGKKSLWQSNQKGGDTQLVIVESPIDALSYHQLNPSKNTRYIATGGTVSPYQRKLIQAQLKQLSDKRGLIIIATDNDDSGDKLAEEIRDLLPSKNYLFQKRDRAKAKDWNEDLKAKYQAINHQDNKRKKPNIKSDNLER